MLQGCACASAEVEDALFEAGCDDATLSMRSGCAYLTFTRAAATLKDAVLSAIRDVRKAEVGADVLRVELLDAEQVALINTTLEMMHQMRREPQLAAEIREAVEA